jgi:hypothetical protein
MVDHVNTFDSGEQAFIVLNVAEYDLGPCVFQMGNVRGFAS